MLAGIILHEHQADERRMWQVGELIKQTGIISQIPITFSMSGMTITALAKHQPAICAGIQARFANQPHTWDTTLPEIAVSTYHNNPLLLPWLPLENWGTYLEHFSAPQARWSKATSEWEFQRSPNGFFPSEMLFAPAAASMLESEGFTYCMIPGEPLHPNEKGSVYRVSGSSLRLIPRVNEFTVGQPHHWDAHALKEDIKKYAKRHHLQNIVVGCDLGEFTGLYHFEGRGGISLEDGIARLRYLDAAIKADPDMHLVNCTAIAQSEQFPQDIQQRYEAHGIRDPHHHITTWMNANGDLSSIYVDEVTHRAKFVQAYHEYKRHNSPQDLTEQRDEFFRTSGMENMMDW